MMYDMTFLNLMKTDYKQNLLTCFQEIACPKVCWTFTHPQAIQNVEDFVSSSEQIWRNVALQSLAHQWILCSEWVPSEWESKQRIKT